MPTQSSAHSAIFYDVDGTLIDSNIVYVYIYYALRQQKVSARLRKILQAAFFSPVYAVTDLMNRDLFNRMFYANYKGITEERIRLLGEEIAKDALLPNLFDSARERINAANRQGVTQVIVSGSLEYVMKPFAKAVGIEHVVANRLEFKDGKATGKLITPCVAGKGKLEVVRDFASRNGIDLSRSYGFADSGSDAELLEQLGYPCAVNPDSKLRKRAESEAWPVLNFA